MTTRISANEYRQAALEAMTEKEFTQAVTNLAGGFGWLVYHTHNSRRSQPGFPDLTMARRGRIGFAELKTVKGRLSDAQRRWLAALSSTEPSLWRPDLTLPGGPLVACWTPRSWDRIVEVLT